MIKLTVIFFALCMIQACVFDPVAYEENKAREHQEHLQQNGY